MNGQAEGLRRLVQQASRKRARCARVIAITSGKGGVGKSNLAANMGAYLASSGQRTAVLDADLGLANVNILLGVNPMYDIGHVISGQKRLLEIGVSGPAGLQLFPGGSGLYEVANLSPWRLETFLCSLAEVEEVYDLLLVDTGAGLSEAVIKLVLSAAEVLLVTTPEPPALADAYGMVKIIAQRSPGARVHVVVNMVRQIGEGQMVFQHLWQGAQRFLGFELNLLGEVPYDPAVNRAVQEQTPFVLAYPRSPAGRAVAEVASELIGTRTPTAGGLRGLIRRMWRARG